MYSSSASTSRTIIIYHSLVENVKCSSMDTILVKTSDFDDRTGIAALHTTSSFGCVVGFLGLQSRSGDKLLENYMVCPQNGTAAFVKVKLVFGFERNMSARPPPPSIGCFRLANPTSNGAGTYCDHPRVWALAYDYSLRMRAALLQAPTQVPREYLRAGIDDPFNHPPLISKYYTDMHVSVSAVIPQEKSGLHSSVRCMLTLCYGVYLSSTAAAVSVVSTAVRACIVAGEDRPWRQFNAPIPSARRRWKLQPIHEAFAFLVGWMPLHMPSNWPVVVLLPVPLRKCRVPTTSILSSLRRFQRAC